MRIEHLTNHLHSLGFLTQRTASHTIAIHNPTEERIGLITTNFTSLEVRKVYVRDKELGAQLLLLDIRVVYLTGKF